MFDDHPAIIKPTTLIEVIARKKNNPKFKKFIAENRLNFKAYAQFGKAEIAERTELLVQLTKLIWNDEMFK